MVGLIIFTNFACSSTGTEIAYPSDIQLSITVVGANDTSPYGDGSGIIRCATTAQNAVSYAYSFDGGELIESDDGSIEYTHTRQGTHTFSVLVFAYGESEASINTTQSVRIYQSSSAKTLVFADEFENDGAIDPEKWKAETAPPNNGSWWNGEKQHYTDRLDNVYVSDGTLKIVAKKEPYSFGGSSKNYTSARLNSTYSFTYGRMEVKAKLPEGMGTWPAIWTLGSNITTVGWPKCGEIDLMEHWGHRPTYVSSAIHTEACSGVTNCQNAKIGETAVSDYASAFHVYAMEWTSEAIHFYLDDQLLYTYNPTPKTAENWPFTQNQFILLNVAMGGSWFDIDPDFEESVMEIDYVRVYE